MAYGNSICLQYVNVVHCIECYAVRLMCVFHISYSNTLYSIIDLRVASLRNYELTGEFCGLKVIELELRVSSSKLRDLNRDVNSQISHRIVYSYF
jgi:hypothetical protein